MSGEDRLGRCAQSAFVGFVAMVKIRCEVNQYHSCGSLACQLVSRPVGDALVPFV